MAVDHGSIHKIVGKEDKSADTSLRARSLNRALNLDVPKTLTPHEWEQWYAEHGVPDSHKKTGPKIKWNRCWFKKGLR